MGTHVHPWQIHVDVWQTNTVLLSKIKYNLKKFTKTPKLAGEKGSKKFLSAIKKNTFESVLMRWMKLEPIIQSEVSQKEKHQYSILIHIYRI